MGDTVIEIVNGPKSMDPLVAEIQRLVLCYQEASQDDRAVVWAALNKYAKNIDKIV